MTPWCRSPAGPANHPSRVTPRGGGAATMYLTSRHLINERIAIMTVPASVEVGDDTRDALTGLATSDQELLLEGLELRADWQRKSGLDPRTFSLVKVAALVALDAPPASYVWQVSNALDAGCTPDELVGVLRAIAPQVGGPRVVAGAAELMLSLGLALPDEAQ
jgi:4-carboxymuconolactone decarboxylase